MSELDECAICCETEDRRYHATTSQCTHKVVICVECVNKHIKILLNEKQLLKIPCPTKGCNKIMERHDIKKIATEEIFEEYDLLAYKITIQRIPDFRWCKVPCGAGQIHIGKGIITTLKRLSFRGYVLTFRYFIDKTPVVICEGCGGKSCYTHEVAWHMGQTCKDYESNKKEADFATTDYILRETKGCPGCSIPIEKNKGCDHMTCRKCSHEFCWL
ncbi:719_t:CDS:2 [Entrophospora sp. SA101]|nr:719_t:CDS:2 [Entrophospora sp. SA101]CAJ0922763.1 3182_t:CDS:2 [Entrophospora sp. SA101]